MSVTGGTAAAPEAAGTPDPEGGAGERRPPEDGGGLPPARTVHYVGFRDDRYWSAYRVFGGPRMIHRRFDRYAAAEMGPGDVVVFAEGDDGQPIVRGAADLDERWLLP